MCNVEKIEIKCKKGIDKKIQIPYTRANLNETRKTKKMKYTLVTPTETIRGFCSVNKAKDFFKKNVENPSRVCYIISYELYKNGRVKNSSVTASHKKEVGKNWKII